MAARPIVRLDWADVLEEVARMNVHLPEGPVWGVPRGGSIVAAMLACIGRPLATRIEDAETVVDDICDSGHTWERVVKPHYKGFATMFRRQHTPNGLAMHATEVQGWVQFPWEADRGETPAEDGVRRLLQAIDPRPSRPGLADTPRRVAAAMQELTKGRDGSPEALLRTFDVEGYAYDEMIVLRDVHFVSLCEHHLMPFAGTATVGYIPNGDRVVGVSKLARLVEMLAARLQIQERLTVEIASVLHHELQPIGCGAVLRAVHSCMSCRGVRQSDATLVTTALQGKFRTHPEVKAEFLGES